MSNIELRIVALGDFSSVNSQIKALQAQVGLLHNSLAGTGLSSNLSASLKTAQADFAGAIMSSGNFTKSTVQLTSETAKFGKALESGKLSLGQYFGIITGRSASAQKSVQALALEQVKLNNSIIQTDITKQGVYSVYTPTKINEISHATEIAAAKQNIYNLAVREGSTQLINFGKNTQWAGRQLTVGLAMPMILFGSQAVASFKAVNTEMTRLQRLYGEGLTPPSQAQINQISGQVLNLGKQIASTMGIAQSETVKVAANFAAMGIQGQNLLDVTTQAQRLSKLGAIDATQATNAIVSLQNVYKISTQDLGNAVNFLSSMQKQTTMSLGDMTSAIPRVGPIMAQLGGNYKDTAVMLLAMREAGVPAAQAANALKSAFASIIAPTSAANKEFASFGINLANIKNAGTPTQMLIELQSALAPLNKMAQEQLIEKLFGKFQFARISALLTNFGKVGSQTQNALKVAGATNAQLATLTGQEMAQATQSTTAKWQRAIETFKADLYPLGQKIIELATKIMTFGNHVAEFFNKLPGPIKTGLGILLTLGVLAGPIIMVTGLLANLVGQGMKVGYSLLGMINGTLKWKDLMTPASIAAKTATDVFNEGLLTNVASVDLLNAALQKMIITIEEINIARAGSAGSVFMPKLPGMATGGYVPGTGNGDTYPAMLTPGEAVIPKAAAKQHAPFITAMINGNLPGYVKGTPKVGPSGKNIQVALSHASSPHGQDVLDELRTPELMAEQQGRLTAINAATSGSLLVGPAPVNENTKGGKLGLTGKEIAQQYRDMMDAGTNPLSKALDTANKMGADTAEAEKELSKALDDLLKHLETTAKDTRFGSPDKYGVDASAAKAAKLGQKHGGTLEELTGSKMDPALAKVTAKGKSGRVWSLGEIQQNFIGTRGEGAGRSSSKDPGTGLGTTGRSYFRDPDTGKISIWSKSRASSEFPAFSQSDYAPDFSTSGSSAYAGINDVKNLPKQTLPKGAKDELIKSGAELGAAIDKGARSPAGINAHSPSLKGEQTGRDYAEGLHIGIDEGMNGSTGQTRIQGMFNKSFGANSKISGMMSKFSGMGMMGKMGVGMGLSAVTQMASPLLNKLPGGGLISEAMTGASMGAGFGPWGMAAGAALSLVSGGIKSLMAQEKLHKQESEADFKVSSDAIQFMGLQLKSIDPIMTSFTRDVLTATGQVNQLGGSVAGKGLTYTNDQLGQFKTLITQLPKDNTLSLVMQQLKSTSDSNAAKNIAQEFVAMQMAVQGMPTDKAKQLLQLMLTASGHSGLAETANAPVNQIKAIGQSISSVYGDATKLNGLLGQIIGTNISTNNWLDFKSVLDAIGSSAAGAQGIVAGLVSYLNSVGNGAGASAILGLQGAGWGPNDVAAIEYAATHGVNVNTTGKSKKGYVDVTPGQAESQLQDPKVKAIENAWATKQQTASVNGLTAAQTAQTASISSNVKGWTEQKKAIDATIKSLELLQQTANKTNTYNSTKEDLKNQILMAQATGDNLKAQLLQQQLLGTTSDYNLQNQIDAKKTQSDALGQKIADANASAQLIATQTTTAAVKAGADQVTAAVSAGNILTDAKNGLAPDLTSKYGSNKGQTHAGVNPDQWTQSKQGVNPDGSPSVNPDGSNKMVKTLTAQAKRAIIKSEGYQQGDTFTWGGQNYRVKDNGDAVWINPGDASISPRQSVLGAHGIAKNALDINMATLNAAAKNFKDSNPAIDPTISQLVANAKNDSTGTILWNIISSMTPPPSEGEFIKVFGKTYKVGQDALQKFAKGGVARTNSSITYHKQHMNRESRHFDAGGHIAGPGTGTSDSIPAMLSNGEYVINAGAVAHYGKGMFDSLNAKHLATGGVARTNSSITYHKQHMNRQSRHFAGGGIIGDIIGSAIGGVDHAIGSGAGWLGKTGLEILGISPMKRVLEGKRQSNWDYLGAASLAAGPIKGLGLVPDAVKPLIAMMEGSDLSQGSIEAGQGLRSNSGSQQIIHHTPVAIYIAKVDSAVDIHKAVDEAFKLVEAKSKMSGRKSLVGGRG